MELLTGEDYFKRPYIELASHPDFSIYAYRVVTAIRNKSTKELEKVNLIGGISD